MRGIKREGLEWERGVAESGGQRASSLPPKVCVCVCVSPTHTHTPSSLNQGADLGAQSLTFIRRSVLCAGVRQARISVPPPCPPVPPRQSAKQVYEPSLLTHAQVQMTPTMRISP